MKQYSYEEFVRVDHSFTAGNIDFYGELSPLSQADQKEFLQKYAAYHKKRFGADASYTKAVEKAEVEAWKAKLHLPAQSNLQWTAYKRKMPEVFEGWQLYSDRAVVQDGVLVLKDSYAWPVPCAKYEFSGENIQELHFSVRISKQYKVPVCGGVLSTTTGRYVELRAGVREIIKLYFSPNGYFTYKDSTLDSYRYKNNILGKYRFGEWNEIQIKRQEDGFSIRFNGEEQTFVRDLSGIDNLFIGGGMQPVDVWEVKPVYFRTDKRETDNLFMPAQTKQEEELCLGSVTLPFVIGTEKNKDYALVLKSKIRCTEGKTYKLDVASLDPGGDIFINGTKVAHKDGFQPFCMDITKYLQQGENELEAVVYPRAPESLFNWHKHNDYYNGWFCQGIRVTESEVYSEAFVDVETVKTGAGTDEETQFDVIVNQLGFAGLNSQDEVSYKLCIQKTYPSVGAKEVLGEGVLQGDSLKKRFSQKVELWTPCNPVLYAIDVAFYRNGECIYTARTETGFRTISQKDGKLYLNGERLVLKGALTMQFLPPYEEVPLNHICPTDHQIIEQALMIKSLNGNCLRMHQLGYGTNDSRFAAICDRLGVLLIWTTRLIDSAENMQWSEDWKQAEDYKRQILQVKHHPSIIIWEGSNEGHFYPKLIDKVYDNFVTAVKEVDTTRLLCPISHLYYSWGDEGEVCGYYNHKGTRDSAGLETQASFGWSDSLVVRSAHPYGILLGYGQPWQHMVTQCYHFQDDLLADCDKAYLVSEFAIIGRQNPETEEAKKFINKNSYELNDEKTALGFIFADEEWELSQAYQALCAAVATKQLRKLGADGMLWCCLTGGANNASYLKPIIDFYGYKKLAYYQLREGFGKVTAFNEKMDVLFHEGYEIRPIVVGATPEKEYALCIEICDEDGRTVAKKSLKKGVMQEDNLHFEAWTPCLDNGYYTVRYTVTEA